MSSFGSHQGHIEREDAAERVVAVNLQNYIDNADKMEQQHPGQSLHEFATASFSTIGDTQQERERFWRAVEDAAEAPRAPEVSLNPTVSPGVWETIRVMNSRCVSTSARRCRLR